MKIPVAHIEVLFLLLLLFACNSHSYVGFFPYGLANNDTKVPSHDDFAYGPLPLDVPLVLFNRFERNLYVSTNGLISFTNPFNSFIVREFTDSFTDFQDALIAPFWADLNPTISGSVFNRITRDSNTLRKAAELIVDSNSELSGFEPELVVIVTWEGVAFHELMTANVTFQCVLATDGQTSFAIFIYDNVNELMDNVNELNELMDTGQEKVVIGFNKGDRQGFSMIPPGSISHTNIYRIDGVCITSVDEACMQSSVAYECEDLGASVCLCDQGANHSTCLSHFFPFGLRSGDREIAQVLEDVGDPIELEDSLALGFFLKREDKIFVSTNGFISFERPPESHHGALFSSLPIPLIAPLWADFDFRSSGTVYYRASQDRELLERVAAIVAKENLELSGFHPTLCVIVTWSQATLFSQNLLNSTQTFQVVLATDSRSTDSRSTFALFIYEDPETIMDVVIANDIGIIGFDAGDRQRSATVQSRERDNFNLQNLNIFRIDGNCITDVDEFTETFCALNTTSLECEANTFTASSCVCPASDPGDDSCELSNFFSFGVSANDRIGPREVDGTTSAIHLNVPIIYYAKSHSNLFISTNGLISFESALIDSYVSTSFPRSSSPFLPLIAPFWDDFNFRDAGTLFYRVTNNTNTLDILAGAIAGKNPLYADFRPTSAVFVTWFQSKLLRTEAVVNFQVVLVTDGSLSFTLFRYGPLDSALEESTPIFGFEAGDKHNYLSGSIPSPVSFLFGSFGYAQLLFSQEGNFFFRIDGNCVTTVSVDICGERSVPLRCPSRDSNDYGPPTCLCREGYTLTENDTCLDFFPFGARADDILVPPLELTERTRSQEVTLPVPMVYYRNKHNSLHISTDGFILFGVDELPSPASVLATFSSGQPLIAPLVGTDPGADFQEQNRFHYRNTTDAATLDKVVNVTTASNPSLVKYEPIFAVVITWFLFDPDQDVVTSVQCILSTDGDISLAIILYEDPDIVSNLTLRAGFDAGDGARRTLIIPTLEANNPTVENIFRIDGDCITTASPDDVCGLNSVATECMAFTATRCSCKEGYQQMDALTCIDINECSMDDPTHNCGQLCNNTDGGFYCSCKEGYVLMDDERSCEDVDECLSDPLLCGDSSTCVNNNGSFTCESTGSVSGSLTGVITGVTLSLLAIAIVIAVIILCVVHRRRKKKHLRHLRPLGDGEFGENEYFRNLHQFTVQSSFKPNIPKSMIIPSCNLQLGKSIGQGEFGIVYRGRRKSSFMDTSSEQVAVKTLKGFVQTNLIEDLMKECAKMHDFNHPNVLTLSGVCLDGGPAPYIVMPYMANGSLLAYLKEQRENLVLDPASTCPDDADDVKKKLLDMSIQVAKGMEYLTSKRVIHRDLAARNCMIDSNFVIKVADFGLSENIDHTKEYFRQDLKDTVKLPIKWMAPECINDGVFSEKSDCWSYGVTVWEVFSGGKTPYPGINVAQLPQQLEAGYRMPKPLNAACTEEIYSVMVQCWDLGPSRRPVFTELVKILSSQLVAAADYMDFNNRTFYEMDGTVNGEVPTDDTTPPDDQESRM